MTIVKKCSKRVAYCKHNEPNRQKLEPVLIIRVYTAYENEADNAHSCKKVFHDIAEFFHFLIFLLCKNLSSIEFQCI